LALDSDFSVIFFYLSQALARSLSAPDCEDVSQGEADSVAGDVDGDDDDTDNSGAVGVIPSRRGNGGGSVFGGGRHRVVPNGGPRRPQRVSTGGSGAFQYGRSSAVRLQRFSSFGGEGGGGGGGDGQNTTLEDDVFEETSGSAEVVPLNRFPAFSSVDSYSKSLVGKHKDDIL